MKSFQDLKQETDKKQSDKWKDFSKAQLRALWLALRNTEKRDIVQQQLFSELVKQMS